MIVRAMGLKVSICATTPALGQTATGTLPHRCHKLALFVSIRSNGSRPLTKEFMSDST